MERDMLERILANELEIMRMLARLASKEDWYDNQGGLHHEMEATRELFKRITREHFDKAV